MKLYTVLVAGQVVLYGLTMNAAGVSESKEASSSYSVGSMIYTGPSLVPLCKFWMVKPYKTIVTKLERGEDISMCLSTLRPFVGRVKHERMPIGGTILPDGYNYTVEQTNYFTGVHGGLRCYLKILKDPHGTTYIALPRNLVIYDVYEWPKNIDLAHLAVLSEPAWASDQMKLLQMIPKAHTSECTWPRYVQKSTGKRFTLIANNEDHKNYSGARNERLIFKGLPSYLQKILLRRYPQVKESSSLNLPNIKAILEARFYRMREKSLE